MYSTAWSAALHTQHIENIFSKYNLSVALCEKGFILCCNNYAFCALVQEPIFQPIPWFSVHYFNYCFFKLPCSVFFMIICFVFYFDVFFDFSVFLYLRASPLPNPSNMFSLDLCVFLLSSILLFYSSFLTSHDYILILSLLYCLLLIKSSF